MCNIGSRREVWREFGAPETVINELLGYTKNEFQLRTPTDNDIVDERHVEAWRRYALEAVDIGAWESLRKRLIQLSFPIEHGISKTPAYLASVRRGEPPPAWVKNSIGNEADLQLEIYLSPAGNIPLLTTSGRTTFVSLVQALTHRNEPVEVPEAMGACMVAGYNNWDRIRSYRQTWEEANPGRRWADEFPRFLSQKPLYQDRFIILSDGPYSGVDARALRLPDDVWREASLIIRREHECTHYFTKRIFGSMRNNIFDELTADYMGIVEVCGRFRADWFLLFMGLENYPIYRMGGRFEHYVRGLSHTAVSVLMQLLIRVAENLETDSMSVRSRFNFSGGKTQALYAFAATTIEGLAKLEPA